MSACRALVLFNVLEAPEVRYPMPEGESESESDRESEVDNGEEDQEESDTEGGNIDDEELEVVQEEDEIEFNDTQRAVMPEGRHTALQSLCISFSTANTTASHYLQSFWRILPGALRRMDCLTSLTISYSHGDTLALKRYTDIVSSFPPSLQKMHFRPISRERDYVSYHSIHLLYKHC